MLQLLKNRTFVLLWTSQIISEVGGWIVYIGVSAWFLKVFDSPSLLAMYMGVRILVGFVTSPWAGHMADLYSRRKMMISANLMRGALVPLYMITSSIPLIFAIGIIIAFFEKLFDASYSSYFPQVIEKDILMKGNSIRRMTSAVAAVMGPGLAAMLLVMTNYKVLFAINAATLLMTTVVFAFLQETKLEKKEKRSRFSEDMGVTFRFVAGHAGILYYALIRMIDGIGSGAFNAALPILGKNYSPKGDFLGYLLMAWGAGTFIGSLVTSRFKKKVSLYNGIYCLAIVNMAVFIGASFLVDWRYLSLIMLFLGGIGDGITGVLFSTYLMENTPNNIMGKVYSIINSTVMALLSVGMFLASAGIARWSVKTVVMVASIFIIISAGMVYKRLGKKTLEAAEPALENI